MKLLGNGLPRWLKKRRVCEEYALSEKRLRMLRQQGLVKFREDGNRHVYLTKSLDDYFNGKIENPDVLNPKNGDSQIMLLKKEVLLKEAKVKAIEEKKIKQGDDNEMVNTR